MKQIIYVLLFTFFCSSLYAARSSQVSVVLGQDTPDDGEARSASATLVKFSLTTKPSTFRLTTSFTALIGSSYKQGEIGFGGQLYPLAVKSKSFVQPFLYVEGLFGVGSLNSNSRMDTGYGLGAGLDILMSKISGINLSISTQNATEASTRLMLGWYTMM